MDANSFNHLDSFMTSFWFSIYATKIQAIWRGYRSRKGQILPCCDCGYAMTVAATTGPSSTQPCSWCQVERARKETAPLEYDKHSRDDLGPCGCLECKMGKVIWCPECGKDECDGLCEPYIPCCMCGDNCYDGDYPRWRFCSRRCMVDASRGY